MNLKHPLTKTIALVAMLCAPASAIDVTIASTKTWYNGGQINAPTMLATSRSVAESLIRLRRSEPTCQRITPNSYRHTSADGLVGIAPTARPLPRPERRVASTIYGSIVNRRIAVAALITNGAGVAYAGDAELLTPAASLAVKNAWMQTLREIADISNACGSAGFALCAARRLSSMVAAPVNRARRDNVSAPRDNVGSAKRRGYVRNAESIGLPRREVIARYAESAVAVATTNSVRPFLAFTAASVFAAGKPIQIFLLLIIFIMMVSRRGRLGERADSILAGAGWAFRGSINCFATTATWRKTTTAHVRILGSILLLLAASGVVQAIDVQIASFQIFHVRYSGTSLSLRIYNPQGFTASDGSQVVAGAPGSKQFYQSVTCTLVSTTATCPSFTLKSTNDAMVNTRSRYTIVLVDGRGVERDRYFSDFYVPATAGSTVTMADLRVIQSAQQPWPDTSVYTKAQTDARIAQTLNVGNHATPPLLGLVKMATAPADTANPQAIDSGNPRLGGVFGSYTRAGLPTPGIPGRNARVTDSTRGLWTDTGTKWIPLGAGYANVLDFGAVGDGRTDDTAAIQAAINSINRIVGGTVYFPAEYTFNCSSVLNMDGKWNLTLLGGSTRGGNIGFPNIRYTGGGSTPFMSLRSVNSFSMENMRIEYTSHLFTGDLIKTNDTNGIGVPIYINFKNSSFKGAYEGFAPTATSPDNASSLINLSQAITVTIEGCFFGAAQYGVIGRDYNSFVAGIVIEGSAFNYYAIAAIANFNQGGIIRNNVFEPGAGVKTVVYTHNAINGVKGFVMTGNWIGDALLTTARAPFISVVGQGIEISGNTMTEAKINQTFIQVVSTSNGVKITGNDFQGNLPSVAIKFVSPGGGYTRGVEISGNSFVGITPIQGQANILKGAVSKSVGAAVMANDGTPNWIDKLNLGGDPENLVSGTGVEDSTLRVNGSISYAIKTVTTSYGLTSDDATIIIDATAGAFNVFLPTAPTPGRMYRFKRKDGTTNSVTISGNGRNIDGAPSITLNTLNKHLTVQADETGSAWYIFAGV